MAEAARDPAMERYLERIRRGLLSLDGGQRQEIMDELSDSLMERARQEGGEGRDFQATAVALAEPPEAVVRRYRDIYGYGTPWTVGAILLTMFVALFTRPQMADVDQGGRTGMMVLMTLIFLVLMVHYSLAGGWRAGLACGVAGGLVRLLSLGRFLAGDPAEDLDTNLFTASYLLVTLAGVVLGFLPGWLKAEYLSRYHWLD